MFGLGMQEVIIIGMIAVMLFGKRLPEVARSLGKTYSQFKKGLGDLHSDVGFDPQSIFSPDDGPSASAAASTSSEEEIDDLDQATAPKFEPPASEPTSESPSESATM